MGYVSQIYFIEDHPPPNQVSDRHVLTAAHCLEDPNRRHQSTRGLKAPLCRNLKLACVANATRMLRPQAGAVFRRVKYAVRHFRRSAFGHDMALLELERPLPLDDGTIVPACVRSWEARAGERCIVAGYGRTGYGAKDSGVDGQLRYAALDTLDESHAACKSVGKLLKSSGGRFNNATMVGR